MHKGILLISLFAIFSFQAQITPPSPLLKADFCQGACENVLKTIACGFCTTVNSGICTTGDYVLCVAGCLDIQSCKQKCEDSIVTPCVNKLVDECYNGCISNLIEPCTNGCQANAHSICEKSFSMVSNLAIHQGCEVACADYSAYCDVSGGGPSNPEGEAICSVGTQGCGYTCKQIINSVSNPQQFTDQMCASLGM